MEPAFEHLPREKQLRILNAAMKVFARNDYRHASTDDIAAQAAFPRGFCFTTFTTKNSCTCSATTRRCAWWTGS